MPELLHTRCTFGCSRLSSSSPSTIQLRDPFCLLANLFGYQSPRLIPPSVSTSDFPLYRRSSSFRSSVATESANRRKTPRHTNQFVLNISCSLARSRRSRNTPVQFEHVRVLSACTESTRNRATYNPPCRPVLVNSCRASNCPLARCLSAADPKQSSESWCFCMYSCRTAHCARWSGLRNAIESFGALKTSGR